jgi:hypothetical protein
LAVNDAETKRLANLQSAWFCEIGERSSALVDSLFQPFSFCTHDIAAYCVMCALKSAALSHKTKQQRRAPLFGASHIRNRPISIWLPCVPLRVAVFSVVAKKICFALIIRIVFLDIYILHKSIYNAKNIARTKHL